MTDYATALAQPLDQVAALDDFHQIRDSGCDVFNPEDHPGDTYLIDQPRSSLALRDVTILLDHILSKKRMVISRSQQTGQGTIRRFPNKNTRVVESCASLTRNTFAGFQVNPEIEMLLRVNEQTGVGFLVGLPLDYTIQGKKVHDHYLNYLHRLKRELDRPEMRHYRRNLKATEKRRIESMDSSIREALSLCRRARLIRVDGNYRESVRASVTPDDISADLDHLIRNMRHNKANFEGLVMAVFKIEYGKYKGFHWHGYFIYDGAVVGHDMLKGKYIRDYWVNTITQGEGSGYNVNAASAKRQLADRLNIDQKHLALGEYRPDDALQQDNLNTLITYLGKARQRIRVKVDKEIQTLRIVKGPRYRVLKERSGG
jgi:hypothetical protein